MSTYIDTVTNKIWEIEDDIDKSLYDHFPKTLIQYTRPDDTEERKLSLWQAEIRETVETILNDTALKHGYYNIISACSYAAGPNPYQAEGLAFLAWRSDVWSYVYANNSVIIDIKTFMNQLPQLTI